MRRHNDDTGDNEMFALSLVTNVIAMVCVMNPAVPGYANGDLSRQCNMRIFA